MKYFNEKMEQSHYFKCILIAKNQRNFHHLDKLKKFYSQFKKIGISIEDKLDSRFMQLLSDAYKLRYFDKMKDIDNFGFFTNQVLCELDYMVNLIESWVTVRTDQNSIVVQNYQSCMANKNHSIHINNYLSMGISKKEFMEMPSKGFGIKILKNRGIFTFNFKATTSNYNGQINTMKITEGNVTNLVEE